MKIYKIDEVSSNALVFLLGIYLIASILSLQNVVPFLKYLLLLVILILFVVLLIRDKAYKIDLNIYWPYILFNLLYLFNIDNLDGVMNIINHIAYFVFSYLIYKVTWNKKQIKQLNNLFYLFLPFFLMAILTPFVKINSNSLSAIILFSGFFPFFYNIGFKSKKTSFKSIIIIILIVILIFLTDSRSIILALVFGLLTYINWNFLTKSKFFYNFYYILICFLSFVITVIYPNINKLNFYPKLNNLSYSIFNKPLLTGRDNIWRNILNAISEKLWTGYGASYTPSDLYSTELSSHNLYLQISLQIGILGVLLLGIFLFKLWSKSYFYSNHQSIRVVCSYLIVIIIHQTFEISLTQNYFAIGLIQWSIISLGFSYLRDLENGYSEFEQLNF